MLGVKVKTLTCTKKRRSTKFWREPTRSISSVERFCRYDITDSVIELKHEFDQIDGDAIQRSGRPANYDAVKTFFAPT
jgi:hypothetical protein